MTLAEALAEYALELEYGDLPAAAVDAAKVRLLDTLACALCALDDPTVARVRAYATGGGSAARVPGLADRFAPDDAALLAGTAIRYLDWNDTGLSTQIGCGHPSDNLGAVLAAADAADADGREVLVATALAYEVHCRFCDAVPLRAHGLDSSNYVLVASTLAVGRLLGLDRASLADAVRIAVTGHVSLQEARVGALSQWKGVAAGNAARNAVVAVELAAAGIDGPPEAFEGRHGLFAALPGEQRVAVDAFAPRGDTGFKVGTSLIKRYPVEAHAQAAVEAAISIATAHDVDPGAVERVTSDTYRGAVTEIGDAEKWDPDSRETADHSLPYLVARALIDREMTPRQFAPSKIDDPTARRLMARVEVREDPAFTEAYGETMPHRLVIETQADRYEHRVEYPPGHPERPLDRSARRAKVTAAAGDRLPHERLADLEDAIEELDRADDVDALLAATQ